MSEKSKQVQSSMETTKMQTRPDLSLHDKMIKDLMHK